MSLEPLSEDQIASLVKRCTNWGRWGPDDELGTLNLITPRKRAQAAALVETGEVVSLARDLLNEPAPNNPDPIERRMLSGGLHPHAAIDYLGIPVHSPVITHLDCLAHVFAGDKVWNGKPAAEAVTKDGIEFGSIYAQRRGVFTRGVFLDVAAAKGENWLEKDELVTADDLDAAAEAAGVTVEPGDAVVIRTGIEARDKAKGPEDLVHGRNVVAPDGQKPQLRAGLGAEAVGWLHDHDVAVFSGDTSDKEMYHSEKFPVALHQIGIAYMGMPLINGARVEELAATCKRLARSAFLFIAVPLAIPKGTGSPVNPIAVF